MKKNKKKQKSSVFTFGELDLTLMIDFHEEDLEKKDENEKGQENTKQYYNIEDLSEIKSLSFLKNNEKVLNRFRVKSKNELIKLLLLGNKNSEKQCLIEYISFGYPKFEGEEEFFNEVLKYITEKNGLNLNKEPLKPNANYSIKIEMSHKGKKKEIDIGHREVDEHEDDNQIKGEGQSSPEEEQKVEDDNDDDEYGDYEPNEMMKKGYIPKFKRKKSALCKLYPNLPKYELIYFNFEDLSRIPGNFKLEDMYQLLEFFKKKKSKIFINYYKNIKEEQKQDKDKKENKDNKGNVENHGNEENQGNEQNQGNEKNQDNEKNQGNEQNKGKEQNENYKGNKEKNKNNLTKEKIEEIIQINDFYYITDIYFFDKKQAISSFDEHYKTFTNDNPAKTINSRTVFDYFEKGIATGVEKEVPCDKTGFFLDEFNKFIIINVSKGSFNKNEFDPQPFPKINTHNLQEVQEYKSIISENISEFYSLFLSEMVISMGNSAPKCTTPEAVIPPFLTGVELVKRKLELLRNKIEIEDEESFYKIKRNSKVIAKQLAKLSQGQKEGKFKLDCTNLITSNKKEYVSLYDYHLKNFFSRAEIRKELKEKGFINDKGYIKYDPVYRNVMGSNKTNKKTYNEEEKKNKIISTIKDINVLNRLQDKEVDCEKAAMNENLITNKKIPLKKEKKVKKHKKNKNKTGSEELFK